MSAGEADPGLQATIAEFAAGADIDAAALARLIETALVATYRRVVADDPSVSAHVDLDERVFELVRERSGGGLETVALDGDLARQAAQAVRAAVSLRRREATKDDVMRTADTQRGQLVDATVESRQGSVWMLRIGDHFGLLPPEEQTDGEELRLHQHIKVMVIDARRRAQDAVLVVSRSHPQLLALLLEQEVPEILSGQVEVRAIAREPGRRAKVAVVAAQPGVDPRGACIGPRGVRHRAVTAELGEEQVQIVTWSEDPAAYIAEAMQPATALAVELDESTHTAHVTVDPGQLSLAIGRGGENARLVARLTGWRIDVAAP